VGAHVGARVVFCHALQCIKSGFAACRAQPEGGLAAQAFALIGLDERFERAIGGWVDMERDRRQGSMAEAVVSVLFEGAPRT